MAITKLENGNIIANLRPTISAEITERIIQGSGVQLFTEGNYVIVYQDRKNIGYINAYEVGTTQVEPAAPVAFNGSAEALLTLLATDFFVSA
jgi:hypothetical protein